MLTLFSVPKPFGGSVDLIQHNALGSWQQLGPQVEVLLLGDDPGVAKAADQYGFQHLPSLERTPAGTPRVDSAFELARRHARHPVLCYVNADIILLDGLLRGLRLVQARHAAYLIVGQRWDLDLKTRIDFSDGWQAELQEAVQGVGRLHPPAGSDYFVFPARLFADMPAFALGRSGWDNWMIYAGRRQRIPVVDATGSITVVHQDHDYAHLAGGEPHYRQPESQENVRLAGGRQTVFTLRDANWRIAEQRLVRVRLPGGSPWRAIEAGLTAAVGSGRALKLLRVVLHPFEFARSRSGGRLSNSPSVNDVSGG